MTGNPIPTEWMKNPVRVGLSTVGPDGESEPSGTLDAANESGLILLQRMEEGERPVFYPWSCIAWVYPKEEVKKPPLQAPTGVRQ